MTETPRTPLTPEQRRARLVELSDAVHQANRATRRDHATTARRRLRAERRAAR